MKKLDWQRSTGVLRTTPQTQSGSETLQQARFVVFLFYGSMKGDVKFGDKDIIADFFSHGGRSSP
jgi:hypothetical protein